MSKFGNNLSSVEKGENFEKKVDSIIKKTFFDQGIVGANKDFCKIIKKPKYYCKNREEFAEFDWSIEIWPKDSKYPELIYIIECKSYGSKLQVDKLEAKIGLIDQNLIQFEHESGMKDVLVKSIFLINNPKNKSITSETFYKTAKNKSIKLIEVLGNSKLKVVLHKIDLFKRKPIKHSKITLKMLGKVLLYQIEPYIDFSIKNIEIKKLNKEYLRNIATDEYIKFKNKTGISIMTVENLTNYLQKEYKLIVKYKPAYEIINSFNSNVEAYIDFKRNSIILSSQIKDFRKLFIIGHEFAHYLLHSETLKDDFSYYIYNELKDSEYDLDLRKYVLKNDKNFMEFQANYFSSNFIIDKKILFQELYNYNLNSLNLNPLRSSFVYCDFQICNQIDYHRLIHHLAIKFNVPKTVLLIILSNNDLLKGSEFEGYLLRTSESEDNLSLKVSNFSYPRSLKT